MGERSHNPLIIKDNKGTPVLLYSVGEFIPRTNISKNTYELWHRKGYIVPQYTDSQSRRWYSDEYIRFIKKNYMICVDKKKWNELWAKEKTLILGEELKPIVES